MFLEKVRVGQLEVHVRVCGGVVVLHSPLRGVCFTPKLSEAI